MLSERLSHEGSEEHIDWLLERNRAAQLLLLFVEASQLLQDLDSVLLRHLKVQQHKANGPYGTVFGRSHHRLLNNAVRLINHVLTMYAVSTLIMHSYLSELGLQHLEINELVVSRENALNLLVSQRRGIPFGV
jgi:hypothetical protein